MAPGPGRGAEACVPAVQTPGVRPPARGAGVPGQGGCSGAARTGLDGTRAAPPHLSSTAFPGAPPGVGEEEPPRKTGRAPPPAGYRGLLQVPAKVAAITVLGASQCPTSPVNHSSNTSFPCPGGRSCRGTHPSLSCQGSEPHAQHPQTTPPTPSAQAEARLRKWPPVSGLPWPKKWAELEPPSLPGSATHTPSKPTCPATLDAYPLPTAQPGMPTQSLPAYAKTPRSIRSKGLCGTTPLLLYEL